ncbi:MAG: hypothetical protein M1828_005921 [Chrysothrix sp. TS-e1954]|nr:MAG: hypothetical protein M1828_005921 [Chrysothrix sp. TS-e1954]
MSGHQSSQEHSISDSPSATLSREYQRTRGVCTRTEAAFYKLSKIRDTWDGRDADKTRQILDAVEKSVFQTDWALGKVYKMCVDRFPVQFPLGDNTCIHLLRAYKLDFKKDVLREIQSITRHGGAPPSDIMMQCLEAADLFGVVSLQALFSQAERLLQAEPQGAGTSVEVPGTSPQESSSLSKSRAPHEFKMEVIEASSKLDGISFFGSNSLGRHLYPDWTAPGQVPREIQEEPLTTAHPLAVLSQGGHDPKQDIATESSPRGIHFARLKEAIEAFRRALFPESQEPLPNTAEYAEIEEEPWLFVEEDSASP